MQAGNSLPSKPAFKFRGRQQLKHDLAHITQEMYHRNRELAETNKTLSLLGSIDALVLDSRESLEGVCTSVAQALAEAVGCPFVGILVRGVRLKGKLNLSGISIRDKPSLRQLPGVTHPLYVRADNNPWLEAVHGTRLIGVEPSTSAELAGVLHCSKQAIDLWLVDMSLKTLYVVKLSARHKVVGAILVGFHNPVDQLTELDTLVLDRVSESVGVALDNKLLAEENSHVLRQLKDSNAKLRALDEAKDDFISMASHQLRTPLTSVKGYLSMVVEGDSGPLNDGQRKLLEQSLRSSDQMVYLISDLLNLSRINTGKFVIEPTPLDLSKVVHTEVDQLREIAKARGLTLTYEKPAKLPRLMLDETKIRQVIMNFIDNAIYYTPAGGSIIVSLHETPTAVEYTVKDTGLGVPRDVQHKLFTKFYRAANAQKARPDGTGLGLFMAKKVVTAQGGAILFRSEEGKGSTFGFRIPKAGHLALES